ncbi:pro-sigmaK processing inhibitor BofA family protein [Clostridium bornimense]|uniref:pro-sigmaK processing inhibitor BofA family protein n=1 Tax=Clostridium bornimense TaxID=1216932 RepID=UPI001C10C726|nr:pro-sigmaK processing inhibitor BofA family protein [Clostridium bornimense]MBU5315357.1 pro-sigmaK processing inhibitor BofA family protein [Clostridium bornimense]
MNFDLIISGVVGVLLLYMILKILKLPIKILINGIVGIITLNVINYFGSYIGITVIVNIWTALISGFLGLPGVILVLIYSILM